MSMLCRLFRSLIVLAFVMSASNASATQIMTMDPSDLTYGGTAARDNGVTIISVTGQPNLKIVTWTKFRVVVNGQVQYLKYADAAAALSDDAEVVAVGIAK